jgi:Na+/H+ antiporter NhaD/arsenite permease-like protein
MLQNPGQTVRASRFPCGIAANPLSAKATFRLVDVMTAAKIYAIFLLTYGGMVAGRLPWLRVDRTTIALLGVIVLLGTQTVTFDELSARIDPASLILLFALMIISEQFVAAGFIDACIARIGVISGRGRRVLAGTILITGGLATFISNDLLVLVATPLLIEIARQRDLNPRPFLIAMIAACNAGSAATIIGAPQTIVIGQMGDLRLPTYLLACGIPAVLALGVIYGVVGFLWRGRLRSDGAIFSATAPAVFHPLDRSQTNKGLVAVVALSGLFCTSLPRDVMALSVMALVLMNRRIASRSLIGGVDWPVLIFVFSLFAVTGALASTALPAMLVDGLQGVHLLPDGLLVLAPLTLLMSNTIGNLPFAILLMQIWPDAPQGTLYGLALLSSFAGNVLFVGSLSNLLVVERATECGVTLSNQDFYRAGIPITAITMAFAMVWLALTGFMPWLPS